MNRTVPGQDTSVRTGKNYGAIWKKVLDFFGELRIIKFVRVIED